jgi:hypothetical protein
MINKYGKENTEKYLIDLMKKSWNLFKKINNWEIKFILPTK